MQRLVLTMVRGLAVAALSVAPGCADDSSGTGDGETEATAGSGSGGDDDDDDDTPTTSGDDDDDDDPTTGDDDDDDDDAVDTSGGVAGTTGEGSTGETSGATGTTGGTGIDCDLIPAGPFAAAPVFNPAIFTDSEDLGFNLDGNLAAKSFGGPLILVDAAGEGLETYQDTGTAFGVRFRANGHLLVAKPLLGIVREYEPDGGMSDFATDLLDVNGLYPDFEDRVWFTNFNAVGLLSSTGERTDVVTGAQANQANGVVYDADRMMVFFTNYSSARIARVPVDEDGAATGRVVEIATIGGGQLLDGVTLDVCGNLYAVGNQGAGQIYRVFLDEDGDAIGEPETLLDAPVMNLANAQFGRGNGFSEESLFAVGVPGILYEVDVGVPGMPVP